MLHWVLCMFVAQLNSEHYSAAWVSFLNILCGVIHNVVMLRGCCDAIHLAENKQNDPSLEPGKGVQLLSIKAQIIPSLWIWGSRHHFLCIQSLTLYEAIANKMELNRPIGRLNWRTRTHTQMHTSTHTHTHTHTYTYKFTHTSHASLSICGVSILLSMA